jgi:hypothetical protein
MVATDFTTKTPQEISIMINDMIQYYNTHGNTFGRPTDADVGTGETHRANIPLMLAHLQRMVGANPATDLQEMIQEDTQMDLEILQAKDDLKVAESRAISLRDMNKQSYYESWFPLNRPLRTSSNLIIMCVGIFFYILSFFIILRSAGVLIDINTTWISPNGIESPILTKLRMLFPFGYGTTIIILVLIVLAIVGFLRKA